MWNTSTTKQHTLGYLGRLRPLPISECMFCSFYKDWDGLTSTSCTLITPSMHSSPRTWTQMLETSASASHQSILSTYWIWQKALTMPWVQCFLSLVLLVWLSFCLNPPLEHFFTGPHWRRLVVNWCSSWRGISIAWRTMLSRTKKLLWVSPMHLMNYLVKRSPNIASSSSACECESCFRYSQSSNVRTSH